MKSLSQQIVAAGGPSYAGTYAEPVRFHDDKTLYTGVCATYHFDRNDRSNFKYGRVKKVDDVELVREGDDRARSTVPTRREHSRRPVTSRQTREEKLDEQRGRSITRGELASQNIVVRDLSTPAIREKE